MLRHNAIQMKAVSRKQYVQIGVGVEYVRSEAGVLLAEEFTMEPARLPRKPFSAIDALREMGLFWEAKKLDLNLNCTAMLHRAPVNSRPAAQVASVAVLFCQ